MNTVTWTTIKSALFSGLITGVLTLIGYIVGVGDLFKLEINSLINVFALSLLTTVSSLIKAGMTSAEGTIAGVKVK